MVTIRKKPDFKKLMYEKEAWAKDEVVCGVDEVGISCFAGPVVAAAVILKPNTTYRLLKDSKLMTPEERLKAYNWITKNCEYAFGIIHHRLIDKINIYQANMKAMRRAVTQLLLTCSKLPSVILVDHVPLKLNTEIPVIHFCKGESKSNSIAAASIIAKVTRDSLMQRMDKMIPGYYFETNKGYGTIAHRKTIKEKGISFCHRLSFISNDLNSEIDEKTSNSSNQSIFELSN